MTHSGIRADIKRKIISAIPVYRFRDLKRVEGIGKQTYNDVFSFLYSLAKCSDNPSYTQKLEVENLSLFEEFDSSSTQPTELVMNLSQVIELEEIRNSSDGLNPKLEDLSDNRELKTETDNFSEYNDAFYIMLPYIEKSLSVGQTKDEIANRFKLPKKLVGDWLEEAEKLGRIRKLSRRPVKYVAASSAPSEQLEVALLRDI